MRGWIDLVEGTFGYIYGDEGIDERMPEADTHVFKTKDGRVIEMFNSGGAVHATIDGEEAGFLHLTNRAAQDKYADGRTRSDWMVRQAWVYEPYRGQGVATAMYDYAYYAGFRPMWRSKSQTEGGEGVWKKRGAKGIWRLPDEK